VNRKYNYELITYTLLIFIEVSIKLNDIIQRTPTVDFKHFSKVNQVLKLKRQLNYHTYYKYMFIIIS
jgi:hypothetical protein